MSRRPRGVCLSVMVTVALLLGGAGSRFQAQASAAAGGTPGDVYLALGDSVAAGIGASRPAERGYAALVAVDLRRQLGRPISFDDLAVPGETTSSMLRGGQLSRALRAIADARNGGRRVSPISITIGANDLLGAPDDANARERILQGVETTLRSVLAQIRAATADARGQPTADLVATTYYDPTGGDPTLTGSDSWWLARLNAVIVRVAGAAGGRIVDLAPLFRGHERDWTWYPSDIHPTNAGHQAIADAVWRALRYDTTPPDLRIERPAGGTLRSRAPTVSAVASDAVGVTSVSLLVDGAPAGDLPYVPDLRANATVWDARSAASGRHTLEVRASDAAGNVATASVVVALQPIGGAAPSAGGSPASGTPAGGR